MLDVRSPELFRRGHVQGAVNLPHARIASRALEDFPPETLFVVYCAGPHCNGADRAAIRLASLGRPVKKMIGGITGWIDEGFPLAAGPLAERQTSPPRFPVAGGGCGGVQASDGTPRPAPVAVGGRGSGL